jgi:GNAT superfamily N-acetyltransferase
MMIQVEHVAESDLPFVYELVQNTIQTSYRNVYPDEAIEFFRNYHSKNETVAQAVAGYTVVAKLSGEIVGTGTLFGANIRRVFVHPNHQGQGIGKVVFEALEQKAISHGIKVLDLSDSLVSRRFWESVGFVLIKESAIPVSNRKRLVFYEMAKTLSSS